MRIGLALPHYDFSFPEGAPLTWPALVDAARRAERLGFDSVWISDHFFFDLGKYGGPAQPGGSVEPFMALAGLATVTERVRLGTLVACAPFRHPAHVAKMASAIDLVTGGRFDLGIGSGWYEPEFRGFGYEFGSVGTRFSMLEESVEVIAGLFAKGPFDFEGEHFRLAGAYNHPAPLTDGGPPVWVGGKGGDRVLRLVARHATGWNTVWRWHPQAYAERSRRLDSVSEQEGRSPRTVRRSLGLYTLVGEDGRDLVARFRGLQRWTPGGALDGELLDDYMRETLTGTPEQCLERLATFSALGVEEAIVGAASMPFAVYDWSMLDVIAEALIPRAHQL
jgi:probable F420-dependent oxidoreductase